MAKSTQAWAVQVQWGQMKSPWIDASSVRRTRREVVELFWSWWADHPKAIATVRRELRAGRYKIVKVTVVPMEDSQ